MRRILANLIFVFLSVAALGQQISKQSVAAPASGGGGTPPSTPANPTVSTNTCGDKIVTRTGTPTTGDVWYWQTTASGVDQTNSNTTYTVSVAGTRNIFIRAYRPSNDTWSTGAGFVSVTVNLNVSAPATTGVTRVEPGAITFSVTPGTNGNSNKWYAAATGGTALATGLTYSPTVSGNITYYVSSYNTTSTCESSRTAIAATVTPKPVISASAPEFNLGNTITLSISNNTYDTYQWKKAGVSIGTTATVQVTDPAKYTVTVTKSSMTGSGTSDTLNLKNAVDNQASMNYVIVSNILKAGVVNTSDVSMLAIGDRSRVVNYVGGLGNSLQTIASQASPLTAQNSTKRDIVQTASYDVYGRQLQQYLPYVSSANDSKYRATALTNNGYANSEQYAFYQSTTTKIATDTKPYTKAEVETSPLGRVVAQTGLGSSWHDNQKKAVNQFMLNRATDAIQLWTVDNTTGLPSTAANYGDYQLYQSIVTDEDNNRIKTYTDKLGRVVQKEVEASASTWLKTIYIYNDLGQLAFTVSPEGARTITATPAQAFLDSWTFQYKYDVMGRVVESKTPNAGWVYTIYDALDRPLLTQNADQRTRNEWTFVKYDMYSRPVVTGYKVIASSRTTVQTSVDAQTSQYETTTTDAIGYTLTNTYPSAVANDLLTISYYDNYNFITNTGWDAEAHSFALVSELGVTSYNTLITGLPTGGKTRMMGATPAATWLNAVQYYDSYYRPIQVIAENHQGGLDRTTNSYSFPTRLDETLQTHQGLTTVTVDRKLKYDHVNRLTKIYQNINSASTDQLVAQYEYNDLGQVVDKKLHNTSGTNFLQSIDYRYTIRGWMRSINGSQLIASSDNDDTDSAPDNFGMELLYNTADATLGNTTSYAGNISAMKWKGPGMGTGAADQRSFKYTYDKAARLTASTSQNYTGSAWSKEANAHNESMAYDNNGNISTLQRNQRKYQTVSGVAGYTSEAVDNLTYTYNSTTGNQLDKVEDATGKSAGFTNGASATTEYTYNAVGNVTADQNKGISAITYNMLNKPAQITFSDGRTVVYTYDASGSKLKMVTTAGGTTTTTDYVNGFVYENNALSFFSSPEGRVVKNGSNYEYQYSIADQQGNTRVVFSSVTPTATTATATYESTGESTQFDNYPTLGINSVSTNNHTSGGTKSFLMNGGYTSQVGVTKSFAVFPGDNVQIEAYARYDAATANASGLSNFATSLLSAFSLSAPAQGETGTASSAINAWGTTEAGGNGDGSTDNAHPKAFINIILFDKNYNFLDVSYAQVTSSGTPGYITASYTVKEAGYAYLYISNEQPVQTDVYFDDVKMTYTPTNVIQYNEYYPFGLQTSTSWTRTSSKNNFLYNDGSELNSNSGWYETFFRGYDAALGRFHQTDPLASSFASHSPYHYAYNNPISTNDPMGAAPAKVIQEHNLELDGKGLPVDIAAMGGGMSIDQWKDFASDLSAISNYESKKDFLNKALKSKSGGTWSDGKTHYFKSDREALAYVQKNLNYIQMAQVASTASSVHYKYDIKFKSKNGSNVSIKSRKVNKDSPQQIDEEQLRSLAVRFFGWPQALNNIYIGAPPEHQIINGLVDGVANGATVSASGKDHASDIYIAPKALSSIRSIFNALGHEYVHVYDNNKFGDDKSSITFSEYNAYSWQIEAFRTQGMKGDAELLKLYRDVTFKNNTEYNYKDYGMPLVPKF